MNEIYEAMPLFLDIFHYLQAMSEKYPAIDPKDIKKSLLHKLPNLTEEKYYKEQLESVIMETAVQHHLSRGSDKYQVDRACLLELLFRWSLYIFSNKIVMKADKRTGRAAIKSLNNDSTKGTFNDVTNS